MGTGDIDFVMIWVDGNDPEWQAEKAKYAPEPETDARAERYRDWGLLPYWFRGAEKFAPWVRKIHFVTWGHLPAWLNTDNPKLNIVKHSDYIPEKYLPTFSSRPIELNLHRINGLSEKFVYFNDDMFIISPAEERLFFKDGLPCDSAVLNVHCYSPDLPIQMTAIRDIGIINRHCSIKETLRAAPFKWLYPAYGKLLLRTVPLMFCPRFPGIYQPHLPSSFLKQSFEELWECEYEILDMTCSDKYRSDRDINQWAVREWQLAHNRFSPRSTSAGISYFPDRDGKTDYARAAECIKRQKKKLVCINDCTMSDGEFESYSKLLAESFEGILPEKSSFEV